MILFKFMIISFDFDGTLCWVNKNNVSIFRRNIKIFNLLKKHIKNKDEIIITTFRNIKNENNENKKNNKRVLINDYLEKYDIKVSKIIFTDHNPKKPYLIKNKVNIHYDDCLNTIESLKGTKIKGILVDKKIKC